jgi:hypothetical protein
MAFSCAMEEVMGMLATEAASSSLALRLKRCRHYINCDREAPHLRLYHDYFNSDYVNPYHNFIDEHDSSFDENYHTIIFIDAPPVDYEAPTSLTSILGRRN